MICVHSGIEVAQKNNLFLAGDVPDDGCKVLVEHALCVWCVGAYMLTRVTGPVVEIRRRVRRRSESPVPGSTILSKLFPHSKSNSVLSGLARALLLPE